MSRAALYAHIGGPEVLYVGEVPDPAPGSGQVIVRVRAAGLNPFDSKVRDGRITLPGESPNGTGSDFAGEVSAVGEQAFYWDGTPVAVGDPVLGWAGRATVRELLPADAVLLARKPASVPFEIAGSLATAGLTAWASLETLGIGAADTVLVSAAAGGVGQLYSQLAIGRGGTVIGTAGPANHDLLGSLGVRPVAYGDGLAARVAEAAGGPVTAVQDNHGRETVEAGLELGVPPERICTIVDYPAVQEFGILTRGSTSDARRPCSAWSTWWRRAS